MSFTDDDVRHDLKKLIGAFAMPDQLNERSGFHLYCMEVAMGFKRIYNELTGNDPPGLEVGALKALSDHVSLHITANEINNFKYGTGNDHEDVKRALEAIKNLSDAHAPDLLALQQENGRLNTYIGNLNKQLGDAIKDVEAKISEHQNKFKADLLEKEREFGVKISDLEAKLRDSNALVATLQAENKNLNLGVKTSQMLQLMDISLQNALLALRKRDETVAIRINELLDRSSASVVQAAEVKILKELIQPPIATGCTYEDMISKMQDIQKLEKELSQKDEKISNIESELQQEKDKAVDLESQISTLDTEKKEIDEELTNYTASIEEFKKFLTKYLQFQEDFSFEDEKFTDATVQAQLDEITAQSIPDCFSSKSWKIFIDWMKQTLFRMLAFKAYGTLLKIDIKDSQEVVEKIKTICNKQSEETEKEMFLQISAAAYGFASPEQAKNCMNVVRHKTNFDPDKTWIYKSQLHGDAAGNMYYFDLESMDLAPRELSESPLSFRMIDYLTRLYSTFACTVYFLSTVLLTSKDHEFSKKISQLLFDFTHKPCYAMVNFQESNRYAQIIENNGIQAMTMQPTIYLVQMLAGSVYNQKIHIDGDFQAEDLTAVVVKYDQNLMIGGTKTFNEQEKKILKKLHFPTGNIKDTA
jgi:hypothetical protein